MLVKLTGPVGVKQYKQWKMEIAIPNSREFSVRKLKAGDSSAYFVDERGKAICWNFDDMWWVCGSFPEEWIAYRMMEIEEGNHE